MRFLKCLLKYLIPVALIYTALWVLTAFVGAKMVRKVALEDHHLPQSTPWEYWAPKGSPYPEQPGFRAHFYFQTRALGPFVVEVKYGSQWASLGGHGGSELYCWIFGWSHWIEKNSEWIS